MRPHISLGVRNVPGSVVLSEGLWCGAAEADDRLFGLSLSGMKSRVQRGRRQLKRMLDACCTIELDRRRGVTAYDVRDQQNHSCGGRSDCF